MKKQYRIAIAEDHTILREGLRALLISEPDFNVVCEAGDGRDAIQCIEAHQPDLILMDLRLPGEIDGFELTRRIKADPQLSQIPVIVLTAYGDAEAQEKAKAAGCEDFLHKPADIRQIQAVLRQFLSVSEI